MQSDEQTPDELVHLALSCIREAVKAGHPGPSLIALATAVGTSGRTLERHFRELLGKPPRRVITDMRLQRAMLLVQTTSMPLADVAAAVGFSSQSRMSDVFRRVLGQSPGAFRARGAKSQRGSRKAPSRPLSVKSSCVSPRRKTRGEGSGK